MPYFRKNRFHVCYTDVFSERQGFNDVVVVMHWFGSHRSEKTRGSVRAAHHDS